SVRGAFVPALRGAGTAGPTTFLVLEDLSEAEWPPPWRPGRVDAVLRTLDEVHATPAPDWLQPPEELHDDVVRGPAVAADPAAVAGFFAARAGLPPPEGAPTVRAFQREQLAVALPWAARELGLDPPTLTL